MLAAKSDFQTKERRQTMTTESTHIQSQESQTKPWLGRILKTGLIFSCGAIAGAVIESYLNDQRTTSWQPSADGSDDINYDEEASSADHEGNEDGQDGSVATTISSIFASFTNQDQTVSSPTKQEDGATAAGAAR